MIKLKNITREFGIGETLVRALGGVSLEIADGEMAAIVGASGSGKSTLMNILGLMDSGFGGEYLLDGVNVKVLSASKRAQCRNEKLGFVLQDFALIEECTVKENVLLPLRYSQKKITEPEQRLCEILKRLGIADKQNTAVSKLSGGQRQRTAIARAIINEPKIILADEPTGALDSKTADGIFAVFEELHRRGMTVIIVTHDMALAKRCGRIVVIADGVITDRLSSEMQ